MRLTQRRVVVSEERFDGLVAQNERQAMEIYSFDLIVEKSGCCGESTNFLLWNAAIRPRRASSIDNMERNATAADCLLRNPSKFSTISLLPSTRMIAKSIPASAPSFSAVSSATVLHGTYPGSIPTSTDRYPYQSKFEGYLPG